MKVIYFTRFSVINNTINTIPTSEPINIYSAIVSSLLSFSGFALRSEKKEKIQEIESNNATTEVNSSMILVADLSDTCKEVITKRQKPSRLAEVPKIWDEVFLATTQFTNKERTTI